MRLRKFDNYARIIQKAMKRFCAVRVYQRQREQGRELRMKEFFYAFAYALSFNIATDILYGRKERNARSLDRDYMGDYCNLHLRPDLQRLIPRNEKTDFSSYLYKYDRRFRRQGRYFISTNQALYIIDEECVCLFNSLEEEIVFSSIFRSKLVAVEKERIPALSEAKPKKVMS